MSDYMFMLESHLNGDHNRVVNVVTALASEANVNAYIAGGAIAGIIIAFVQGVTTGVDTKLSKWAETMNPFYGGAHADSLALLPYLLLCVLLYFVGRGVLMSGKAKS